MMLDESGSMSSMRDSAIQGFNENVQQIKADAEENPDTQDHTVCLVTFNGNVDTPIWMRDIDQIEEIDTNSYSPNGMTSLRDAIGQTVADLQRDLKSQIEDEDINLNILITILSDGMDTSSKDHDPSSIKALLGSLDMDDNDSPWTINYIGATEDCLANAQNLGMSAMNTSQFVATGAGTSSAMRGMSSGRSSYTKSIGHGLSKLQAQSMYNTSSITGEVVTDEDIAKFKAENNID